MRRLERNALRSPSRYLSIAFLAPGPAKSITGMYGAIVRSKCRCEQPQYSAAAAGLKARPESGLRASVIGVESSWIGFFDEAVRISRWVRVGTTVSDAEAGAESTRPPRSRPVPRLGLGAWSAPIQALADVGEHARPHLITAPRAIASFPRPSKPFSARGLRAGLVSQQFLPYDALAALANRKLSLDSPRGGSGPRGDEVSESARTAVLWLGTNRLSRPGATFRAIAARPAECSRISPVVRTGSEAFLHVDGL